MNVGVRDLRNGLSRYLSSVREGQEITVTDHGRPIATLRPVGADSGVERLLRELLDDRSLHRFAEARARERRTSVERAVIELARVGMEQLDARGELLDEVPSSIDAILARRRDYGGRLALALDEMRSEEVR